MPFGGGGEPCTLCSKTVYPAEKLKTSTDNVYHQKCFSCTKCKRGLQVSTYCEDAVTGRLYCKVHYEQMAKAAGIDAVARGVTPALHSFPYTNEPAHRPITGCVPLAWGELRSPDYPTRHEPEAPTRAPHARLAPSRRLLSRAALCAL